MTSPEKDPEPRTSRHKAQDLRPGDIIRLGDNWETVLSRRVDGFMVYAATHEPQTDTISLRMLDNSPEAKYVIQRRKQVRR